MLHKTYAAQDAKLPGILAHIKCKAKPLNVNYIYTSNKNKSDRVGL